MSPTTVALLAAIHTLATLWPLLLAVVSAGWTYLACTKRPVVYTPACLYCHEATVLHNAGYAVAAGYARGSGRQFGYQGY